MKKLILIIGTILIVCLLFLFMLFLSNTKQPPPVAQTRVTPSPTHIQIVPKTIDTAPTLAPQKGLGLDLDSQPIKDSKIEIQKAYPYLPFTKTVTLSTGVPVTIDIPQKEFQFTPWVLAVNVRGINFNTSSDQEDYALMRDSFKEVAGVVFVFLEQNTIDPKKIYFSWGDRAFMQDNAERWLSE
jgi:hypothetical protein